VTVVVTPVSSTDIEDADELPTEVVLDPNYPNPFNPTTTIGFALPEAVAVQLEVFDVMGRRVAVPVDGPLPAGRHTRTLRLDDLPSGVYVYRLSAGTRVLTRTMQLVK